MSRIGKKPIELPKGIKLAVDSSVVNIEGPKGKLSFKIHPKVKIHSKDGILTVEALTEQKTARALQGTARSILSNMIKGVTDGFSKELVIEGVGFKAQLQGKVLNLALGFTHPVLLDIPANLTVESPKPTQVIVKGADKAAVGLFAAKIRKIYEAEPYKGKGVKYSGEVIRRKAGKTVAK